MSSFHSFQWYGINITSLGIWIPDSATGRSWSVCDLVKFLKLPQFPPPHLYEFSLAAITNLHKLGGLKQYVSSLRWLSVIKVSAGLHSHILLGCSFVCF
jgi:hypothetical protein